MSRLLLLLPILATSSPPDELDDALAPLHQQLAAVLEELAEEAQELRLYLQRDRTYAALLHLEPDHRRARRILGYRRDGDGGWERRRYRKPRDRAGEDVLEAFHQVREERAGALRDRAIELLEEADAPLARRERELAPWLALSADDAVVRRAVEQARDEAGRWVLADTVRARRRAEELRDTVRAAREAAPEPRPWDVPDPVADVLSWRGRLRNPAAGVATTSGEEEARVALEAAWVLRQLLPSALPRPEDAPARQPRWVLDAYLLEDEEDLPALLDAFPSLPPEDRELFLHPSHATGWLLKPRVVAVWGLDRTGRLDALSRQVAGKWLRRRYGLSTRQGWAWEGFGLALSHAVVGTRLTFFVRGGRYDGMEGLPNFSERLRASDADWLQILVEMMESEGPPRLVFLLGKDVNGLNEQELVVAHGLASWLLLARPRTAARVLDRIGAGEASVRVLEEECGLGIEELERRLVRWAGEMSE